MGKGLLLFIIVIGIIGLGYWVVEFLKTNDAMDIWAGVFITISLLFIIIFGLYTKKQDK